MCSLSACLFFKFSHQINTYYFIFPELNTVLTLSIIHRCCCHATLINCLFIAVYFDQFSRSVLLHKRTTKFNSLPIKKSLCSNHILYRRTSLNVISISPPLPCAMRVHDWAISHEMSYEQSEHTEQRFNSRYHCVCGRPHRRCVQGSRAMSSS